MSENHPVDHLTLQQLNEQVAIIEGFVLLPANQVFETIETYNVWAMPNGGKREDGSPDFDAFYYPEGFPDDYGPATDPYVVMAIINREKIAVRPDGDDWYAAIREDDGSVDFRGDTISAYGPNPMVAAMKCFVMEKRGVNLDV